MNKKNTSIKIFVACHKDSYTPDNPYLIPVQVGAALSSKRLEGAAYDDKGENISHKNKKYCELTAHYWAWKNEKADFYGFFHYRRYLSFNSMLKEDDEWGNVVREKLTKEVQDELLLLPTSMETIIPAYDLITVKGRKFSRASGNGRSMNVYDEYDMPDNQHRKDLDTMLEVLDEKYPEFKQAAEQYMNSNVAYECNMFIMKKELFYEYCEWLFGILFETEKRIDTTWYSVEEYRVMGYLAERLFGIYYTHLKMQGNTKTLELPKVLICDTTPQLLLEPTDDSAVPIVLSANDKFAPYLDVMIRSVVECSNAARKYDIVVLYNDISEKNQNWISAISKGRSNISIRFIKVSEYFDKSTFFIDQHLSIETYYRLIIPEIMPNYHKILYLDCDMVVTKDVAELYDTDLGDCVIAAAKDIDVAGQIRKGMNGWEDYATKTLGLDQAYHYFQAGVLVIDLEQLRKITSSEEMIKLATYRQWRCHDQDVLNVICKNRVYYLPQEWNVLMNWEEVNSNRMQIMKAAPRALYDEYMVARKKPGIVHFAGYQKPWNVADCDFAEYFWQYAIKSPYYPRLIKNVNAFLADMLVLEKQKSERAIKVKKYVNRILPYGSKRRSIVKKILHTIKK